MAENSVFYTLCASCLISLSFWTSLVLHCHDWLFANLWITLCVLLKCSKYLNLPRNCPLVFRDKKIILIFVEATYDFTEKKFQDQFLWLISFHFPSAFYHLLITMKNYDICFDTGVPIYLRAPKSNRYWIYKPSLQIIIFDCHPNLDFDLSLNKFFWLMNWMKYKRKILIKSWSFEDERQYSSLFSNCWSFFDILFGNWKQKQMMNKYQCRYKYEEERNDGKSIKWQQWILGE